MPSLFFLALGFSTRLWPARMADSEELGRTIGWLPAVGVVLGVILALPLWFKVLNPYHAVQALGVVGLNFYLTRGLHLDGWADIWDAWGSSAQGDTFWEILKDSRCGAFAVIGITLGLTAHVLLLTPVLEAGALGVVVFGCILGRFGAVALANRGRGLERNTGMGAAFLRGAIPPVLLANGIFTLACGVFFVGWGVAMLALALLLLPILGLQRLAQRQGGMNGDFLGAVIVFGELLAPLAWMLSQPSKPFFMI